MTTVAGVIPIKYTCGHERTHTYLSRADLEQYKRWSRGVCPACIPRSTPSEAARRLEV